MVSFHPFEVTIPHITYAALGAFVVLFGMFSLLIREKLYIGEACLAFIFGIAVGPYGVNIFDPRSWGDGSVETSNTITLEFSRVVLAIGVFAIGVELPKAYMKRHWKSIFFLIVPCMTWGWFVCAGIIYALVPGLNFLSSLAVAACLTPTDPILAAAVVGGKYADKHVPAHLRHLLAAESGCNDGAAFPFLYIALYLIIDKSTGNAIANWFLLLWLYQVILGVVIGGVLGWSFRHLMKFCERKELIDRQSYVAQYVSLAMLTIGICTLVGSDDLLAAFSCGTAFAWDGFFNKQTEETVFSSVVDLLFNVAAFVFVGAWMPFHDFHSPELSLSVWRLVVIGILILLLRRLPIMIALYKWIPDVKTFREAVFSGHFGPMGIGAVFISTLAAEQLTRPKGAPQNQEELLQASIQPIVAFIVLCSIMVHGLSIPFFSLGRRVHTVSRTWSRRDTLNSSAPEWTTHTRRVSRPEDVVINRDSAMERGELTPDEKLLSGRDSVVTAAESGSPRNKEKEISSTDTREEDITDGQETLRGENPPNGTEVLAEWKEGPHRIVERRAGPGEEVEVEVEKNAFTSDADKVISLFRGEETGVRNTARAYVDRIKQDVDQHVGDAEARVQHGLDEAGRTLNNVEHKARDFVTSPPSGEVERDREDASEDEGWLSDGEGPESNIRKPRSRSPKHKIVKHSGAFASSNTHSHNSHGHGKRRRNSIRRGIFSLPASRNHSQNPSIENFAVSHIADPISESTTPPSDISPAASGTTTPVYNGHGGYGASSSQSRASSPDLRSPQHIRIQSVRSAHGRPREASPARSVRFAADSPPSAGNTGGSGSTTPRGVGALSPRRDSAPLPDLSQEQENDSPKSKVTFDLPHLR